MTKLTAILFIALIVSITSCETTRNITTKYIKNEIEKHVPGQVSELSTLHLLLYGDRALNSYLEMCAVKYNGEKLLVIASDRYVSNKAETNIINYTYFKIMTVKECEDVMIQSRSIWKQSGEKKGKNGEVMYIDYTIQKDLFLSVGKRGGATSRYYSIWVDKRKHVIEGEKFLRAIRKFLAY